MAHGFSDIFSVGIIGIQAFERSPGRFGGEVGFMRWWWFSGCLFGGWDGPLHCWLHAAIAFLHNNTKVYYASYR